MKDGSRSGGMQPVDAEEIRWEGHAGAVVHAAEGFHVVECDPCGFRHLVPVPSAEELARVYRHEYYATEKPLYLERHREDLPWLELGYGERYDAFEAELPAERRRLLEVGSGPGYFLSHGSARGWQVLGVEPARQAAAHARGLGVEVVEEFLTDELAPRLGTFDVVHLSDVLEHVPDPRAHLTLCRDLLAPGGLLSVTVPNDENPLQRALLATADVRPWWVAPPHHVNYFDFDSLAGLLERTGFDVVSRDTSFPMELFLLMGEDYVGDEALGRRCHERRVLLERRLHAAGRADVLRDLYRGLARLGLGRHAILLGRRR